MIIPQIDPNAFKQFNIKLAYLFGSRSKGTSVSESDFDIAVLFNERVDFFLSLKRLSELSLELAKFLPSHVDVISLNDASLLLKYEVIANNTLLYSDNEQKRIKYEVVIIKEYFDEEYTRRIYNNALYERIEQGAS